MNLYRYQNEFSSLAFSDVTGIQNVLFCFGYNLLYHKGTYLGLQMFLVCCHLKQ